MKRWITGLLALTMTAVLATSTAFAAEINQDTGAQSADTTISINIAPAYTVTIPEDVSVIFNETSTDFGKIELTDAKINPGYAVQVDLKSSGALKNAEDSTKTIEYVVNSEAGVFTAAQYDAAGESTALTIDITEEAWNTAHAGQYSDTVTFTVSYVKVQ